METLGSLFLRQSLVSTETSSFSSLHSAWRLERAQLDWDMLRLKTHNAPKWVDVQEPMPTKVNALVGVSWKVRVGLVPSSDPSCYRQQSWRASIIYLSITTQVGGIEIDYWQELVALPSA